MQNDGLTIHFKGSQPVHIGSKIGQIPFGIAAERHDIEGCVIQQVFELHRQVGTGLRPIAGRHAAQIQVVSRLRIIARVTGFQKIEDRLLRRGSAQRILYFRYFRSGSLGLKNNCE